MSPWVFKNVIQTGTSWVRPHWDYNEGTVTVGKDSVNFWYLTVLTLINRLITSVFMRLKRASWIDYECYIMSIQFDSRDWRQPRKAIFIIADIGNIELEETAEADNTQATQ
jgi:hypothetical protein